MKHHGADVYTGYPGYPCDRALVTRRRMVRAAYDLFSASGYLGTTMSEVAQQAGVAVPTIYYTFGTKAVLLEEALGAAIVGFDRWREPPPDPESRSCCPGTLVGRVRDRPNSAAAFAIFFTNGVAILERVAPLSPPLHGAVRRPRGSRGGQGQRGTTR